MPEIKGEPRRGTDPRLVVALWNANFGKLSGGAGGWEGDLQMTSGWTKSQNIFAKFLENQRGSPFPPGSA